MTYHTCDICGKQIKGGHYSEDYMPADLSNPAGYFSMHYHQAAVGKDKKVVDHFPRRMDICPDCTNTLSNILRLGIEEIRKRTAEDGAAVPAEFPSWLNFEPIPDEQCVSYVEADC